MDIALNTKASEDLSSERLSQAGAAVADLAHLVKNILQVLSGCSEIIELALSTNQIDRARQAWQLFQPSFWRLKKFQLDLIKFTKSYSLNLQPCELDKIIATAVKQVEPFFSKRCVHFINRPAENMPSMIVDSEKLRDAVINLLVTAVDNLQDEPGQITMETALIDSGGAVQISVSDSGPRLDAETCLALFSPAERCRNMVGSGLEIPLTKQVAEAHHGRLLVNTDTTGANTLLLILPLSE